VSEPVYQAASPETLRIVELDGLTALYHRPSGQTHLVTEPVPQILMALVSPRTAADLLAALGADDAGALDARLGELVAIGLVEVR
jgi:PqqD family protein of HPr-rel-A system